MSGGGRRGPCLGRAPPAGGSPPPPRRLRGRRRLAAGVRAAIRPSRTSGRARGRRRRPRAGAPGGAAARPPRPAPVDRLTLEQQVGQTLVLRFAGTTAPGYVRRRAARAARRRRDPVPRQRRRPARSSARSPAPCARAGGDPLVAVDQEGGEIRIVPWAPPAASAPPAGRRGHRARRRAGRRAGAARGRDHRQPRARRRRDHRGRRCPRRPRVRRRSRRRRRGRCATPSRAGAPAAWRPPRSTSPASAPRRSTRTTGRPPYPHARRLDADRPAAVRGRRRGGRPARHDRPRPLPGVDARRSPRSRRPSSGLLRERLGFRRRHRHRLDGGRRLAGHGHVEAASERALRAGADLLLLTGRAPTRPCGATCGAARRRRPARRCARPPPRARAEAAPPRPPR